MKREIEKLAWGAALALIAAAVLLARLPGLPGVRDVLPPLSSTRTVEPEQPQTRSVAQRVAASNPFRFDRQQVAHAFVPSEAVPLRQPSDEPMRPELVGLSGPPWRAILEGIPGVSGGFVAAPGDTINGYAIAHVGSDSVVIERDRITWRLTLRRPQ